MVLAWPPASAQVKGVYNESAGQLVTTHDDQSPGQADLLALRAEIKAELNFLHDRVNALVSVEAFLTIAFTAALSSSARWSVPVAMVLAGLGFTLAWLAWAGVSPNATLILELTLEHDQMLSHASIPGARRTRQVQTHSVLFFRVAPALFTLTWLVLAGLAVTLHQ